MLDNDQHSTSLLSLSAEDSQVSVLYRSEGRKTHEHDNLAIKKGIGRWAVMALSGPLLNCADL